MRAKIRVKGSRTGAGTRARAEGARRGGAPPPYPAHGACALLPPLPDPLPPSSLHTFSSLVVIKAADERKDEDRAEPVQEGMRFGGPCSGDERRLGDRARSGFGSAIEGCGSSAWAVRVRVLRGRAGIAIARPPLRRISTGGPPVSRCGTPVGQSQPIASGPIASGMPDR